MTSRIDADNTLLVCAVKPREVAVAIPIQLLSSTPNPTSENIRIWLVSSRKHANRYVLPKGGVEKGESSRTAAIRELWEEAGLIAAAESADSTSLSRASLEELTVLDHKAHKESPTKDAHEDGFVARAKYTGHEVLLGAEDAVRSNWPEKDERVRKTFTVQEAEKELEWRKDIHTIFTRWAARLPTST